MTVTEARHVFAKLMQRAREGSLTQHERSRLTQARQLLRRSRRPAMNAARVPHDRHLVELKKIKMGGIPFAFVVMRDGEEIGFITKYRDTRTETHPWKAYVGIGEHSTYLGAAYGEDGKAKATKAIVDGIPLENRKRGNPRAKGISPGYRKIWFSSKQGTTAGLVVSEQSFKSTRSVEAFSRLFPHTEARYMAKFHYSPVFDTWDEAFAYPTTKSNPGNPAGRVTRLGPAEEVRYQRMIGRSPGYYKHEIRSRRARVYAISKGWYYVNDDSILITEETPRVHEGR